MPLIILGLVFLVGIIAYNSLYVRPARDQRKQEVKDSKEDGNVIFLPNDIEQAKKDFKRK